MAENTNPEVTETDENTSKLKTFLTNHKRKLVSGAAIAAVVTAAFVVGRKTEESLWTPVETNDTDGDSPETTEVPES